MNTTEKDVDTTHIYENFKKRVEAAAIGAKFFAVSRATTPRAEFVFGIDIIEDGMYGMYRDVLSAIELSAKKEVEWLFVNLCTEHNIPVVSSIGDSRMSRIDHDFLIEKNDKIIQVDFKSMAKGTELRTFPASKRINSRSKRHSSSLDEDIYSVYLIKKTREGCAWLKNNVPQDSSSKAILLADFILEVFGEDELNRFELAMVNFSAEMQDTLGYQITQIGNERALHDLREQLYTDLLYFDYSEIVKPKAETSKPYIEDDAYYTIVERFKYNYKLLLGNSDFAISFLTSEWLYRQHGSIANLDNTFVVAGYFKSIEQMLWGIISTVAVGKYIGSSRIGDEVDKEDTMLGSLKKFLNYDSNTRLFNNAFRDDAKYVQRYLNYQLDNWITNQRNGYFHKHNLNAEQVYEIREQTYFLYFLILGSLKLTNDDIKKLMG